MALMPLRMTNVNPTDSSLTPTEKNTLLDIARATITHGVQHSKPLTVSVAKFSPALQQQCATFVTLNLQQQLRGCIGTLEAHQPLIQDVAEHAFAAAFEDPRFAPVTANEVSQLDIHIALLTPATAMHFTSEDDLLQQLQPGIDGLILQSGAHRATFLPAVWESLPEPKQFLRQLKLKAGLEKNFWNDEMKVSRYSAISIG